VRRPEISSKYAQEAKLFKKIKQLHSMVIVSKFIKKERLIPLLGVSFIGDTISVSFGLIVAHWVRFQSGIISYDESWWTNGGARNYQSLSSYTGLVIFGTVLLLFTFLSMNLYRNIVLLRMRTSVFIIIRAVALWLVVYLGLSLVIKFNPPISRIFAIMSAIASGAFVLLWRFWYLRLLKASGLSSCLIKKLVFFGWGNSADRLVKSIQGDRGNAYSVVGIIRDTPNKGALFPPTTLPILGDSSNLVEVLRDESIDIIVRSDGNATVDDLIAFSSLCDREMVQFKMIPTRLHSMIAGLHLETISDVPILGVADGPLVDPLNRILKRSVDIVGSIVGLVISGPLICLFGALVYLESPGPIIYRQTRTGRNGRNFQILKIRSMRLHAEAQGGAQWAKKGDDRRLKVGAFMRATNIDEVPQFWNVIKGEMSLVGPRPERPELIAKFQDEIPHYNARLKIKPGMTGWAQVNGLRGDTDLTERVRYDLFYIERWTLLGDFLIMLRTFFNRNNAY
jgi:exopolysaccharide biosynthesis polyprenyl glycosylphosphotransferase